MLNNQNIILEKEDLSAPKIINKKGMTLNNIKDLLATENPKQTTSTATAKQQSKERKASQTKKPFYERQNNYMPQLKMLTPSCSQGNLPNLHNFKDQ